MARADDDLSPTSVGGRRRARGADHGGVDLATVRSPCVDLPSLGYVEEEWFASGTASSFASVGELCDPDGFWDLEPGDRRPTRPDSWSAGRPIPTAATAWSRSSG